MIAAAQLIVVAPSNPFVSVAPILSVGGVLDALLSASAPVIGVSPIVGGNAVRGPAAAMIRALGGEASAAGIARHYARAWPGLLDVMVIDRADSADADQRGGYRRARARGTDADRRRQAKAPARPGDPGTRRRPLERQLYALSPVIASDPPPSSRSGRSWRSSRRRCRSGCPAPASAGCPSGRKPSAGR